jgi:hypothetical protein
MHAVVDGQGHAIVTWSVDAAGAVTARRWAGSWGDAVTLADSGFFQHHLAVNATGQAAVLLQVANKVAVARFDGAAWEATEDLGVASSASFSDAVGLDAAGDIFILNGGSVAGAVRRWDATTRAWGLDHAIKNGCHSLAVSPVGTAMVTQCQYSSYLGSTGIVVDHWNGAAWDAPQTLQADYASSLVFRAYPTAIDRFVLFWYEGTYGVTFNHWGTLEAGVWAASPDTTTLWASNKSTAFLVSPENKVAIVGGRQSMLGLWAERLR